MAMRLVYKKEYDASEPVREVQPGDSVIVGSGSDARRATVVSTIRPHKPASTGRVEVRYEGDQGTALYYPSVIGALWIERDDQ